MPEGGLIKGAPLTERTQYGTLSTEVTAMTSLTASKARARLYKLLDQAAASHEPIQITGKRVNAVLVSEEDWRSIQETLYLLSIPGMRESIRKGLKEPVEKCRTGSSGELAARLYAPGPAGFQKAGRFRICARRPKRCSRSCPRIPSRIPRPSRSSWGTWPAPIRGGSISTTGSSTRCWPTSGPSRSSGCGRTTSEAARHFSG